MPRNVDADKVISHLNDEIELCGHPDLDRNPIAYGTYLGLLSAKSFIETAETADVQEVRHGNWIYHECVSTYDGATSGYSCSECCAFIDEDIFDSDMFHKKFCGNCNAKMDVEE